MSFRSASQSLGIDRIYSTLQLNGGSECNPNFTRSFGDFLVKGGGTIKKNLRIGGNAFIEGNIIGDVCGDLFTGTISEKTSASGIFISGNLLPSADKLYDIGSLSNKWGNVIAQDVVVCGNLFAENFMNMSTGNLIEANIVCATESVQTDLLLSKSDTEILIGNDIDMLCGNIANVDIFEVDTIIGKGGQDIIIDGNIIITGEILSGNLVANIPNDLIVTSVTTDEIIANTIGSVTQSGNIFFTSPIDMNCLTIGNIGTVQVDTIIGKNGDNITIDGDLVITGDVFAANLLANIPNDLIVTSVTTDEIIANTIGVSTPSGNIFFISSIDMNCLTVGNIGTIETENIVGKNGGNITINGDLVITGDIFAANLLANIPNDLIITSVTTDEITANTIGSATPSGNIFFTSSIDMNCLTIGNVETLQANVLIGKNGNAITIDGNLVITGEISAPNLLANIPDNIVANSIVANTIQSDQLSGLTGNISITSSLDMNCLEIGNVELLRVQAIESKSGSLFIGDLDLMQSNIANVNTICVQTIKPQIIPDDVLVNNVKITSLKGSGTGSGNVVLLRSDLSRPEVPLDEIWCFSIDIVGREIGTGNIYCERQFVSAWNNAGNVQVTQAAIISKSASGSLIPDSVIVSGNASGFDIIVMTNATAPTVWSASMLITTVV